MSDRDQSGDQAVIDLRIPAVPEFARLARLTAARLARRHGFTYREVEDLRLAVDEAMVALLAPDTPGVELDIRFAVTPSCIEITFNGDAAARDEQAERFDAMVGDLVDERSLDRTGHSIHLVKRHAVDPPAAGDEVDEPEDPTPVGLRGV